jgi:redox-regulated HSP33 family molecular chaperone
MTTVAEVAADYTAQLAQIKSLNLAIALQASHGAFALGEQIAVMALQSPVLDDKRKAYDSLTRKAEVPEKLESAKATASAAAAILQIILDDSVPQVAPPKRKRATQDLEDAVEVSIALPRSAAPALDETDELAWGLE